MGGETLIATKRRRPWELTKFWPAGEYSVIADSYTAKDGGTYAKGETIALSEREATWLGTAGTVASPTSMYAVRARVESGRGTLRDEYLCQMWELTGVWEEQGPP
jgi:hypothetical protein